MIILGIAGPIGHGKSSLAHLLCSFDSHSIALESSEVISEVATELNKLYRPTIAAQDLATISAWTSHLSDILQRTLGVTAPQDIFSVTQAKVTLAPASYEKLLTYIELLTRSPELASQAITQATKAQYRPLLQWIGGMCAVHMPGTVWFDELIKRARSAQASGATMAVIGGVRFPKDADTVRTAGGTIVEIIRPIASVDSHEITERQRSQLQVDCTLQNDGDLATLQIKAQQLYNDLVAGALKPNY